MTPSEAPFRRTLDVRLAEDGAEPSLRRALVEAGCAVTPLGMGAGKGLPDAVVADLRGAANPLGVANRARRAAGATPLVLVAGPDPAPALAEIAEAHVMVQLGGDPAPLVRALGRAVRAADMAGEAGLRLAAMTALEQPLHPDASPVAPERLVLLGPPSPHALETYHGLAGAFPTGGVLSRAQALRALEAGDAGALVLAPGPERRDPAALLRLIRRQSVLRDVPVLVIEQRRTARHVAYWSRMGADGVFLPHEAGLIGATIRAGLRRRTVGAQLRSLLERTVTTDAGAESRLCGSRLFDAGLEERCRRGTPFALGAVRLSARGAAPDPAALSEAAVYLSFGAVPEDLLARPAPDTFLVQMPTADARGAERTTRALAALVGDLMFGEEDAPSTFEGRAAVTTYRPGDDAAAMIVRAMEGLKTARVRVAASA